MHLESKLLIHQKASSPGPQSATNTADWDIADVGLPQVDHCDEFELWPDGYVKTVYEWSRNERVRRHASGWAMRNTNNHNRDILKKSCLGVLQCAARCQPTALRPAICDKARKKQLRTRCTHCGAPLILQSCRGNLGYPVTHYWRRSLDRVFFQAKGTHDHARPDLRHQRETRAKLRTDLYGRVPPQEFASPLDQEPLKPCLDRLDKDTYCFTCRQIRCECQRHFEQLLMAGRPPAGVFWSPYWVPQGALPQTSTVPPQLAHTFYHPTGPAESAGLVYSPAALADSFPLVKTEQIAFPDAFPLAPFRSWPAAPPEAASLYPLNYSRQRSFPSCRYPGNGALSANFSQTDFHNFKY